MKLIVTSNRIPITVSRSNSKFVYNKSSGGLVTGIESLSKNINFIWIGSIGGMDLASEEMKEIEERCWEDHKCLPVFLSTDLNDHYYDGFCNAILWPALHSFPDDVCFTYDEYAAYKQVNQKFAERILEKAEDGDIVWIHDYHLMLVPRILREKMPSLKILFFLHTTFPDPSNLEQIIYKDEILSGICASDVAAFHLPEYALNFREATKDFDTDVVTKAISIGIDPAMFRDVLKKDSTKLRMEELRKRFEGKKVILGVDRTDYIKGMPHKLKGFKRLLARNPELEDKLVFLQIGIPSRLAVKEYSSYVSRIGELVTEVNGCTGNIVNTPVHMLFKSVAFDELVALYAIADIMLITSIMDGMNLVALEYVACQDENMGVVVLSRFAGATATLQGAVLHNPNNTEEIAEALERALTMDYLERSTRHLKNKRNVDVFTSFRWAEKNLDVVSDDWRNVLQSDKKDGQDDGKSGGTDENSSAEEDGKD